MGETQTPIIRPGPGLTGFRDLDEHVLIYVLAFSVWTFRELLPLFPSWHDPGLHSDLPSSSSPNLSPTYLVRLPVGLGEDEGSAMTLVVTAGR